MILLTQGDEIMKRERGFSGLEAAVVLIAFVVVAAVFSYVMLGVGFFATQRFQEVTYSAVKQSTSTVITDGLIRGQYNANLGGLQSLSFSLSCPETGEAIALSKMVYYYVKDNQAGGEIPISQVFPNSGLLSPGSSVRVRLDLTGVGAGPMAGGSFSLEIKPPVGASTLIQRSLPDAYGGGYIS